MAPGDLRQDTDYLRFNKRLVASAAFLAALAATTLVNPYGFGLPREWLDTLTMPLSSLIEEHGPMNLTEPVGWATAALAAVYAATLIGVFPKRPRITWLVPMVWFALALLRVRNAPLFGVTAAIALAEMLPYSRVGRWLQGRGMLTGDLYKTVPLLGTSSDVQSNHTKHCLCQAVAQGLGWRSAVLPMLVVSAAAMLQIGGVKLPVVGRGWARFDRAVWPVALLPQLDEINRSAAEGTLIFNDLKFGGFLIYHEPRLRVFVDDRCPL